MNRKKEVAVFCSNKHKTTRITAIMDRSTSNCKNLSKRSVFIYIHTSIYTYKCVTYTYICRRKFSDTLQWIDSKNKYEAIVLRTHNLNVI